MQTGNPNDFKPIAPNLEVWLLFRIWLQGEHVNQYRGGEFGLREEAAVPQEVSCYVNIGV